MTSLEILVAMLTSVAWLGNVVLLWILQPYGHSIRLLRQFFWWKCCACSAVIAFQVVSYSRYPTPWGIPEPMLHLLQHGLFWALTAWAVWQYVWQLLRPPTGKTGAVPIPHAPQPAGEPPA